MTDPVLPVHAAGNTRAVLRPILVAMILGLAVILVAAMAIVTTVELMAPGVLIVATAAALYFVSKGRVAAASYSLVAALLCTGVAAIMAYGSIRAVTNLTFVGAVVVAGIFLGRRALVGVMILATALVGALTYAEASGTMTALNRPVGWIHWLVFCVGLNLIGLAVHYSRAVAVEANEGQRREIEERAQAEATIRRTEERLRLSMEATHQGWFDLDVQSGTVVASVEFARMVDADPVHPDLTLQTWLASIHSDERAPVLAAFQELLASGETRQMDYRMRTRAGEWRWIRSIARVVQWDDQHRPLRVTGTHADISDQMRAKEALSESEAHLRLAFEHAIDAIFESSLEGKALAANPAFVRMFGYESEEDVLNALTALPRGLWANLEERAIVAQRVQEQGFVRGYECEFLRKDGTKIWISLNATAVPGLEGQPGRLYGSIRDISERKQAEAEAAALQAQLMQAQRLETVGRLAGGVAHDFNNMLGVILCNLELVLDQLGPESPLYADLLDVQKAAERSTALTAQLLAFARKQIVVPSVLDINEVVGVSLAMMRRLIGENIDVAWQPNAAVWPISMDRSQLEQIVTNLCVNARDAVADVGRVTVVTDNRVIDSAFCASKADAVPGEYVQLSISDNGCGMETDVLEHVFEPFFTTKDVGKGVGLGLASVYGAVRQNGGFITASSAPGKGTTFEVFFPRHLSGIAPEPTAVAMAGHGCETVLLVEDEPNLLNVAARILTRKGYSVLSAGTPADAIHKARSHTGEIHLLLTDVIMPGMNGADLARKLLSLRPQMKCLFMSGYTTGIAGPQGVLDDGMHFIRKPFSAEGVAAKVREVLDGA